MSDTNVFEVWQATRMSMTLEKRTKSKMQVGVIQMTSEDKGNVRILCDNLELAMEVAEALNEKEHRSGSPVEKVRNLPPRANTKAVRA